MRQLIRIAALLAVVASAVPVGPVTAGAKERCPDDKPPVVDVTLSIDNLADFGEAGNVWALDDVEERVRIYRVGTHFFCARFDDVGTFTSFAGVSPGATGTISSGVTGSFVGARYLDVAGVFAPTVSTTGDIGDFDAGCDQTGACASTAYRITALYFSRVNARQFGWYSITYDGSSHGTFTQSIDGNSGDITG